MKLLKIGASGLKNQSFELDLKSATFLVGPNYVGKTARADAIRLLLVGHLPELGKLNSATFGLASGKEMKVWGEFDNGTRITRRWFLKGDSVKTEASFPSWFKEGESVEVMLNADSWFGLTERERVDWVYRNVSVETERTRVGIAGKVGEAIALQDGQPADPKLLGDFVAGWIEKISEFESRDGPFRLPDYVEVALNAADEIKKAAGDHAKTMNKTVAGLAGLRAADAAPGNLAETEAKIAAVNAEISQLRDGLARAEGEAAARRGDRDRRERLKRELAGKPGLEAERDRRKADRDKLDAAAAAKRDYLAAYPVDDGNLEESRREDRDATSALATFKAELGAVVGSIERNERERGELSAQTFCPYCKAVGDGWKTLKTSEFDGVVAGLRSKKETLETHVRNVGAHVEGLRAKIKGIEARAAAKAKLSDEIRHADGEVRKADEGLRAAEARIAGLAGKEGELAAIPEEKPEIADARDVLTFGIKDKKTELDKLDADRRAALGRANDLKRLAEAEKGRADAQTEEKIAKTACDELRAIKAEMVAVAFTPLLAAANAFSGSLLKTPLDFNTEKSEIGTWRDGAWVGHKTFSGVERLLTYAAVQAAFSSRAPVRVMILDEMMRAQGSVFSALMERCVGAVRTGMIDNFVGIMPAAPGAVIPKPKNWKETDCAFVSVG